VAIIAAGGEIGPADPGTKSPEELVALYAHHPLQQAFLVTWLGVVLLGRIAIPVGIRAAVRQSGRPMALADVAVGAMVVSVVEELMAVAVVGAGAYLANHGADPSTLVTLDAIAGWMWRMIVAPLGASIALSAWSMLRSRLFPAWMCWMGLVGGAMLVVAGLVSGPAYSGSAIAKTVADATMVGVPIFWLWMLITGVFLFRKAPPPAAATSAA
jgi:hypothetical protein